MISIIINQNHLGQFVGFSTEGHADYADAGFDIICSAVSVLTINTINSIERYTDAKFKLDTNQEDGRIEFVLKDFGNPDVELLMNSMVLGLQGIKKDYGNKYISLNFKEV